MKKHNTLLTLLQLVLAFNFLILPTLAYSEQFSDPAINASTANIPTQNPEPANIKTEENPSKNTSKHSPSNLLQDFFGENNQKLWFAFSCGILSLIFRGTKYAADNINDTEDKRTVVTAVKDETLPLIWWIFSAAGVGFLAVNIELLAVSTVSAVTVGASWPTIYKRILGIVGKN